MDGRVMRVKKRFPRTIFPGITLCLENREGVAATLLICCGIDCLSKYYSGEYSYRLNKSKYISFLKEYFSQYSSPEDFYAFIRCGLVHGYNMERKYRILNSNQNWAQKLHMIYDPKHKTTIINSFVLFSHFKRAFKNYISDVLTDKALRDKFLKVYPYFSCEKQYFKSSKFDHLKGLKNDR
jgi:hypothetical protein